MSVELFITIVGIVSLIISAVTSTIWWYDNKYIRPKVEELKKLKIRAEVKPSMLDKIIPNKRYIQAASSTYVIKLLFSLSKDYAVSKADLEWLLDYVPMDNHDPSMSEREKRKYTLNSTLKKVRDLHNSALICIDNEDVALTTYGANILEKLKDVFGWRSTPTPSNAETLYWKRVAARNQNMIDTIRKRK